LWEVRADLATGLANLGLAYDDLDRLGEAEDALMRGVGELRAVLADHPEITQYQGTLASMLSELGRVRGRLGRLDDAGRAYDEAIAVSRRFLDRHPKAVHERGDLARLLGNVADLRVKAGRLEDAVASEREALELRRQVAAADPSVPRSTYEVVISLQYLDGMLRKLGRSDEAEEMIREAVAIGTRLVRDHPEVVGYASQLSESTARLARVLDRPGDLDRAEASYRAALGYARDAAARAPGRPDIARQVTLRLIDLASSSLRAGRVSAAREALSEATADVEARLGRPPVAPLDVKQLAEVAALRANACRDAGDPAEAITGCDRALALVTSHIPAERASEYAGTLARLRGARAKALTDLGRHPEALSEWGRAIAAAGTEPDDPQRAVWPRAGRAWSLARAGDTARALAELDPLEATPGLVAADCRQIARALAAVAEGTGRDDLVVRALALLARGLATPQSDLESLAADRDLASLRDRPGFRPLTLDEVFPARPFQRDVSNSSSRVD
jgi:tetratricopeptide (TPR) repeat protein